jgi:hypothetical protein
MTPKVRLTTNFPLDSLFNTNKLAFCDKKSEKIFKEKNENTDTKKPVLNLEIKYGLEYKSTNKINTKIKERIKYGEIPLCRINQ